MPSRRFASSRSARLRGALFEMWAARTPVFAIASARRSRYFFDEGCEGSKSPRPRLAPDLRLQELRVVLDVPEVAREEVHLRDAGVGVARELREVEERDLAVLLLPGVALLLELLAPPALLVGHARRRRERPLLEEVADRPAVRGEPLQLLLARGRRPRPPRGRPARRRRRPTAAAPPAAFRNPRRSVPVQSIVHRRPPCRIAQAPNAERRTCEALRHGRGRVLLALHLERHPALVAGLAQDAGDPRVVEVERVPLAAAVVRLGLHDDRVRRELLEPGVRVAGEVAGVEVDAEPGRAGPPCRSRAGSPAAW